MGSSVSREALTFSGDMMAAIRPSTRWTGPTALVPKRTGFALAVAAGSPKSWPAHTCAVVPQACVAIGAVVHTGLVAVRAPQSFCTGLTAPGAGPSGQTVALPSGCLASISLKTVTSLQAAWAVCSHGARLVTVCPLPASAAGAGPISRVAFGPVGTQAGGITPWAPGPI